MNLKGNVAVVTGAASGIGREIARTFCREGAKVVIADLNQAGAAAAATELGDADSVIGVGMDVTDETQVDAGMAAAVAAFGGIDILVSNAGIQTVGPLDQFEFVVAKEGAKHGVRANVVCPGFVRTPLVEKQIPEQAKALGISESDVVRHVMLRDTVDGEFTTLTDVAEAVQFLASFGSNALTGQSLVVSHGWFMQ
jgi:NAD(P)-dependent dehydrogenase (short-subunit alcohol dehydrogenase family)